MYRYPQKEFELNITFDDGGLGDDLGRLPIIKYVLDKHPHIKMNLFVKSYFLGIAKRSLPVSKRLNILTFDDVTDYHQTLPTKKFTGIPYTNLASHMTEQAFHVICNTMPQNKNYLNYLRPSLKGIYVNRFNLPKKYVIITTGYTAKVREFKTDIVNNIANFVLEKGYTPVYLGKEQTIAGKKKETIIGNFNEDIEFSKGINLINETSLLESIKIIKEAAAIVGLDNGLLHLAGVTDIPIVGGFTTVNPLHRMPYRYGVKGWNYYPITLTENELKCNFCQSNMTWTFRFDFRNCYYCDYQCCNLLSAEKYIIVLDQILD